MSIETSPFTLAFDGALTVSRSEQIHAALREALNSHPAVDIDCSGAEDIDVSFLQILMSAGRTALAGNKSLRLSSPPTGLLADAIHRCGFHPPVSSVTPVADLFRLDKA